MKNFEKFRLLLETRGHALQLSLRSVILIVLFVGTSLLPTATSAQVKTIHINFTKAPLEKIFKSIADQSGYTFLFSNEVNKDQRVTVNYKGKDIYDVMTAVLSNTSIDFKIERDRIVLFPKSFTNAPAKKNKVILKILDQNGDPLPGATITIGGVKGGAISDPNGNAVMNFADSSPRNVTISFVGMMPCQFTWIGENERTCILQLDSKRIDQVVVTGYQTISKERATSSYSIIKADQIEKPTSNIAQRIVGTTSGVQTRVDADGKINFEIRGQTSLSTIAQPLVVVDGFAIDGDLSSVNPNDIESITILKDAAAASIWGARSANGVIVLTSKSGKENTKGRVKVDVNSFVKFSPKIDLNYYNGYASSAEIVDYERKGFSSFFQSNFPIPNSNSSLTSNYSAAVIALNENRLGLLSNEELNATLAKLSNINNTAQIRDNLLQNPLTQQYNINISGNTEKMTNNMAIMYEGSDFYYKGNHNDKYMFNYRTNTKLFKWLDFSFGTMFSLNNLQNNGEVYTGSPYHSFFNEDGSRAAVPSRYYMPNIKRYVPTQSFPYSDWTYNPISELESKNYRTSTLNARVQAGLNFKLLKGLTFDSKIQYEMINTSKKNITDESAFQVRYTVNEASTWDKATNKVTLNLPKGGFLDQSRNNITIYNWRNQANFNQSFGERHQISIIAGSEITDRVAQTSGNPITYGYNDDKLTVAGFPNGVGGSGALRLVNWQGWSQSFGYTNSYSYSTDRYYSLYGNASYTYNQKYTLSGSARTDASNLITDDPKYRYSPFWSIGGSWSMHKEYFMHDFTFIDRLIVRTTYGYNGNVDKTTSPMPLINVSGTQNSYIQDYTAYIASYGNPTLRWERTGTLDFGIDFDLFHGKLFGKVDVYNRKGTDLLVYMSIPAVNGSNLQKLNKAEMTNKGIEVELGTFQKITSKISWSGNFTFSYNKNKVDKLFKTTYTSSELSNGGSSAYLQGYDANTLWAYKYAGVVNKGTEASPDWQPMVQGKGDQLYGFTSFIPGDARDFMLNMGTTVAPYTIGFSNSFKIYDFDLSFIITGKFGHVFKGLTFNYPSMFSGYALPNKLYNETLNSNPMERVPIPFGKLEPRYYFWDRFYPYLDYRVQSANHARLDEVNISYNLPRKVANRLGINAAKVYAQGNNLLLIQNNKYNEDPEFPIGSLLPLPSFTLGINVSL